MWCKYLTTILNIENIPKKPRLKTTNKEAHPSIVLKNILKIKLYTIPMPNKNRNRNKDKKLLYAFLVCRSFCI